MFTVKLLLPINNQLYVSICSYMLLDKMKIYFNYAGDENKKIKTLKITVIELLKQLHIPNSFSYNNWVPTTGDGEFYLP